MNSIVQAWVEASRRRAARRWSRLLLALLGGLGLMASPGFPVCAEAAGLSLTLSRQASDQVLFDWYKDRCEKDDLPDLPPRAIRDFRGTIHLFAANDHNRRMTGPDFDHLRHSCASAFEGHHADDPALFDDRDWLTSFATEDGRNIVALVHEEFHGNLRPALCPSRNHASCWENALTFAYSADGGYSFREPPAPEARLVASLPHPYQGEVGHPIGYFQPTNIVKLGDFSYVMFLAVGARTQPHGVCVARTANPADPKSWRAWDGTSFSVRFINPYTERASDPTAHVCAPVGKGSIFEMGSLTQDLASGLFVSISGITKAANKAHPAGVYVATSPDLIHWSEGVLLASDADLGARDGGGRYTYGFFSLIDQRSPARDFSTIAAASRVFLYYVKLDRMNAPFARLLVRRPVAIERR